jgi:hypothetical protein
VCEIQQLHFNFIKVVRAAERIVCGMKQLTAEFLASEEDSPE